MTRSFRRKLGNQKGFTLIELMIVVSIIGILAAIASSLYAKVQQRARIAKAKADSRALASAVSMFSAHMARLPAALADLTAEQTNDRGQKAGPFMNAIPAVPAGWDFYTYTANADGTFTITSKGDGTTVTVP